MAIPFKAWLLRLSPSFVRQSRVLSGYVVVQMVVQAINFGSGLLIVRSLTKADYAYYTVAMSMQGLLVVLSECGVTIAVVAISGRVWQDPFRFGQLIHTALRFRNLLAAVAVAFVVPSMVWLLRQNGCSWSATVVLSSLILVTGFLQLEIGTLMRVPLMYSQVGEIQKLELVWAGSRLTLVLAGAVLRLNAIVATTATFLAYLYQRWCLRRLVHDKVELTAPPHPDDLSELTRVFKNQLFNALYFCAQGQIVVWLAGVFGNTTMLADVGALGRFGIVTVICGSVMHTLVQPVFARCHSFGRLVRLYSYTLLGLIAIGVGLVGLVTLFPSPFLLLLGKNYQHLGYGLTFATLGIAVNLISAGTYTLNAAKGWIALGWLYAPVTIAGQVLLLCFLPVTDLRGVLLFGALSPVPSILLNLWISWQGFRSLPSSVPL